MKRFRLLKATRQSTEYSCGASALQAVLSYWGKDLDEDELMKLLKTTPETGTYPEDIVRVAKELGFEVELKENLSIDDLEKATSKGVPVIALGQAWRSRDEANMAVEEDWQDGHYVVILAVDKDYVYFEDPFVRMGKGFMPRQTFEEHWHNIGGKKSTDASKQMHLGIIIRGKRPAKNKSLKQLDLSNLDFGKIGPLQLVAIEFQGFLYPYDIVESMKSILESGIIRPVAFITLYKDKDGKLTALEGGDITDEEEMIEIEAIVAEIAGLRLGGPKAAKSMVEAAFKGAAEGDFGLSEKNIQRMGEELPPNTTSLIVLFEHLWGKQLRDIVVGEYGGVIVNQRIISRDELDKLGAKLKAESKAGGNEKKTA